MNKNIDVAMIEPVGGHGGMNYYDFGLCRGLSSSGCKVILYTSEETTAIKGLPFEVKKTFKRVWSNAPKVVRAIRFVHCLFISLKDARKNGLTIIHYHFFNYTLLERVCISFASLYGFKIIVTAHDVESFTGNSDIDAVRRILVRVDRVIAHNMISKKELIEKISLPESLIRVVPIGNHLDRISGLPDKKIAREKLGLLKTDKVILFFGQIKKVKGLDILLQALPEVIKKYPELKLLVAGRVWKDSFSYYENIINENGMVDSVISHIRYIPDIDVAYYYRSADLVVLPYRRIYQSDVLLMALSYTLPVLVSDIPGMTEIIRDRENGYIFESENVASLSLKLADILNKSDELNKVGQAGYKTVEKEHDWNKIGAMTSKIYEEVCCDQ